jgi:hypothetical protein
MAREPFDVQLVLDVVPARHGHRATDVIPGVRIIRAHHVGQGYRGPLELASSVAALPLVEDAELPQAERRHRRNQQQCDPAETK